MFAGEGGGEGFAHQSAAHLRVAVDADRNADPAAAQGHAEFDRAFGDDLRQTVAVIRIIDANPRFRAEIGDIVAFFDEPFGEFRLKLGRGVI